jgi:phosphoglycolate phosphatase/pyrophosphatase PpaX
VSGSVRLSALVFDLDGTIAETHPMAVDLIGGTIAAHGGPVLDADGVIALFGPDERGIFRSALGEGWEAAWSDYLDRYVHAHRVCPEPFPGLAEVLRGLHRDGVPLALVTGKTATTGRLSLEVLGLSDLFPIVEGGSMEGWVKAACIGRIVTAWGLPPGRVAYVADTPGDVPQARDAGVRVVSVAWSSFADPVALAAEAPDALFEDVPAFAAWLAVALRPG